MPLTLTRTFRVRYCEVDAYGHVNNANYLRYIQEAAFDATAAAGYDLARYDALQRSWLARETDIEYLRPLRYQDEFEVKTWVHSFQRVRSRRMYELRKRGESDLVARAHTDWAFIDRTTGRPAAIPPELIAAFIPEGETPLPPPRERIADPPVAPQVFRSRRRVEWADIDTGHMVNNPVYLSYAEDCAAQSLAAYGWPITRMATAGFGIFARRNQIEYRQPAVWGDELEIGTWVYAVRRTSALRAYTITRLRDGALLARALTHGVCVDLATGRPVRFPEEFVQAIAPNLADDKQRAAGKPEGRTQIHTD